MSPDAAERYQFKGPQAELLEKFAALMDRLWNEHRTSPTRAAKEEFYAWGNIDFAVVMSAHRFNDLVEIRSKFGDLDIKKDPDGKIDCHLVIDEKEKKEPAAAKPAKTAAEILHKTIVALNHYYYSPVR